MIKRYITDDTKNIWNTETKYKIWKDIELSVIKAFNKLNLISDDLCQSILKKAKINSKDIQKYELTTKHDVAAFLLSLNDNLNSQESRWIHFGLTSSDIVDTGNSICFQKINKIINKNIQKLLDILLDLAFKYRDKIFIGRTHGKYAEPISLGHKFYFWYNEILNLFKKFKNSCKDVEVVKISGSLGNFAHISPKVEIFVGKDLKLNTLLVTSQIVSRERYSYYFSIISIIGNIYNKIATNLRLLNRPEVNIIEEEFISGQIGSSSMPHKKNPILLEKICGLSRILNGNLISSLMNINIWDERDISHSSADRIIFSDSTLIFNYLTDLLINVLKKLKINEDNIYNGYKKNEYKIFSQKIALFLIRDKKFSRIEAFNYVREKIKMVKIKNLNIKNILLMDKKNFKNKSIIDKIFKYDNFINEIKKRIENAKKDKK